ERVIGRVPPPAEARALAGLAGAHDRAGEVDRGADRMLAHAHEHGRHADAPERLVAGTAHAMPVELLVAPRLHGLRREAEQLRRGEPVGHHGVALGAGRVDVDVHAATPGALRPAILALPPP